MWINFAEQDMKLIAQRCPELARRIRDQGECDSYSAYLAAAQQQVTISRSTPMPWCLQATIPEPG